MKAVVGENLRREIDVIHHNPDGVCDEGFLQSTRIISMRHRIIVALLLPFICASSLYSQNQYNFSQFKDETIDFLKQPAKWEGDDWLKLGLVSAGTFLIMQTDQPVRDAVMKDRSYVETVPVKFGKLWGETYSTAAVAGVFALDGVLADNNSSKKIGFEIAQAALYAGGITTVLKAAVGRARPYTDKGAWTYSPFTILDDGFHSLPSGHTTLAFALSTVLARNTDSGTLKVLAYIPATLTIVARIYQDYHWASDCVLGAAIGYAAATWVVNTHAEKDSPVKISSIYPLTIRINLD